MKIRFRVFDGEKMIYPSDIRGDRLSNAAFAINQIGDLIGYFRDKDSGERWWYGGLDVTHVMLSTELKDRNGKEIWDGDILEFDEKEWGNSLNKWKVQRDKNYAIWDVGGGRIGDCEQWKTVVGNIHEHPDVLKQMYDNYKGK